MPTKLKNKIMGTVSAMGFPGTGRKMPKYATTITAMKTQRIIMNLP